jgi:hypothetical protein
MRRCSVLVAVVVLLSDNLYAQTTTTGSMSGTVVDSTGQVLPGANVTIINEPTGEERHGTTNDVGDFSFPALVPAPYTIRVTMSGFRPLEVKGNVVLANGRLAVGLLRLDIVELTEVVSVSAVGEALATTRTSHEAVLDLQQVTNLSIRGRDPVSLLKILPGVQLLANDAETFGGSFGTEVPDIQGGRGQTIYVDGINVGDGGGGGRMSGATNLDAIAEVNVQMSVYTAEYGLKGGSQVNFVTKRGGTDYHGTLYAYKRHDMFNATNFFNNKLGIEKPEYRYTTLGGNLGGPVPRIPRINEDKKLFFFYSVDDTRLTNPQGIRRFTVPSALERAGNFSQTQTTSGALIQIRDPLTGQPFPGNIIPMSRANAQSLALLNLLPMPNASGPGYNYVYQEPSIPHPRRNHLTRIDFRPTSSDTLSVKYQTWFTKSAGINVSGTPDSARWPLVRRRYDFTADQGKIDYTKILGSNSVLEFAAGVFYSTEDGPPADEQALAGLQRSSYPPLANIPQFAPIHNPLNLLPKLEVGTLQNNSHTTAEIMYDNRWPIYGADTALNGAIRFTHTRGAHTFKAGVMHEYERFGQARSGIFGGEFDFSNDTNNPSNTGFAYANAFLGVVTRYREDLGRVGDNRRQNILAWFVQDTWKPARNLTLDLGLRMYKWDHPHQGGGEASAFSFERFDPAWGGRPPVLFRPVTTPQGRRALNPLTGEILPSPYIGQMVPGTGYTCTNVITPNTPCQINGIVVQQNGDYVEGGRGFIEPIGVQFDPRLGMAYALNDKTVLRAAAGAFHDSSGGPTSTGGPAFRFEKSVRYTDMNSFLTGTSVTAPVGVSGTVRTDQKRPVAYRYTIGVQRDIGWNTVLDLAYVGDTTHNLSVSRNYNAIAAGARFLPENRDTTVTATAANPGALPDVFLRPIPGFGDISISEPVGRSRYDSLQMQVTRRFTGRIELAGSYTFAKGSQNFLLNNVGGSGFYQNNPLPPEASRARTDVQPHVLVASYIVDIPDLTRKKPLTWVLNNWRVSGISTFATGAPASITFTTTDNFDFTGGGERCGNSDGPFPNIAGDPKLPRGERSIDRWFNTDAFRRPSGRGDRGNVCSNDHIVMPGFSNHDLSLFKDFQMKANQKMQFRWEIYNLFNTVQFDGVDRTAQFDATGRQTDVNFGTVTSARNERRMQFSLRYSF